MCELIAVLSEGQWLACVSGLLFCQQWLVDCCSVSWLLFCQKWLVDCCSVRRPMVGVCECIAVLSGAQRLVCVSR